MVNDLQEKFFCPRLIDYIVLVGSYSPLSKHSVSGSDFRSSKNHAHNQKHDNSTPLNRSTSVTTSKTKPSRTIKSGKKSLYSVGRALTCSSFSISNSGVSHIRVRITLIASTFIVFEKLYSNLLFFSFQAPDLLRRFPEEDHKDFALPKDVVCFCQPEGCITTTGRLSEYNKVSSFVFTISDKDTGMRNLYFLHGINVFI